MQILSSCFVYVYVFLTLWMCACDPVYANLRRSYVLRGDYQGFVGNFPNVFSYQHNIL